MTTSGFGRFAMILLATVFCVVMLFTSLVAQVLHRLSEVSEETYLP
jgi:archaellin